MLGVKKNKKKGEGNFDDLWYVMREGNEEYSKTPELLPGDVNTRFHEGPATANESGSIMFFTRNLVKNKKIVINQRNESKLGIYMASLDKGRWASITPFPFNKIKESYCHPTTNSFGDVVIFSSNRKGGLGGYDLYISRFENGKWTEPKNLGPNVNSPSNELFPFFHNDKNLFFSSNRRGGTGGLDIYQANLDEFEDEEFWSKAENLGTDFNSPSDDLGFFLNREGTFGGFASNRVGGLGKDDIYLFDLAEKPDFFVPNVVLETMPVTTSEPKISNEMPIVEEAKPIVASYIETLEAKKDLEMAPDDIQEKENANTVTTFTEITAGKVIELKSILYEYGKFSLTEMAAIDLEKLANLMLLDESIEIELSSHTDSRGSALKNLELSQKRANTAKDFLVKKGVKPERIKAVGYGEAKLRNRCADGVECPETKHQRNRRTEVKVLSVNVELLGKVERLRERG